VADRKIERTRVEPVVLNVATNPLVQEAPRREGDSILSVRAIVLFILEHWATVLLAAAVIFVLIWIGPGAARTVRDQYVRRRAAYRQSEAFAYAAFRGATRRGNARDIYRALLGWVARFEPAGSQRTLAALKAVAHDPKLDAEIVSIEHDLFGQRAPRGPASFKALGKQVGTVRRRSSVEKQELHSAHSLSRAINPGAD
jgi:hypothetical protein